MATADLDDLIAYLDASPSPWHAVASTTSRLGGFTELDESAEWTRRSRHGASSSATVRSSPGRSPTATTESTGFRIGGAHTDSPGLRVKPRPDTDAVGWKQLAVEVYGGILNNTWLDRDLGVAGRVVGSDGSVSLVDVAEPIARVPQLAVHLDRGVNDTGLILDPQRHLTPVWGVGVAQPGEFARWIGERAGLDDAPAWWELCLYDVQGAAVIGADRSLLTSARLDNQLSCWAATVALAAAEPDEHIALIVLNDHEEVGSASTTGAQGPFLETVIERLVLARGGTARRPAPCAARVGVCLGGQRARRASELRRASRTVTPADRQCGPGGEGQLESALRDLGNDRRSLPGRVRAGEGAMAGVRVPEQHAVRLDDRTRHRHSTRDRHGRRRGAATVDALGA